jgi:hypothetical protein
VEPASSIHTDFEVPLQKLGQGAEAAAHALAVEGGVDPG